MRVSERLSRLEKATISDTVRQIKVVPDFQIDDVGEWMSQVNEAESARARQALTGIVDLTWRRERRGPKNLKELNALLTYRWLDELNGYEDCSDVIIAKLKQAGGVEVESPDHEETALPATVAVRIETKSAGELTFAF